MRNHVVSGRYRTLFASLVCAACSRSDLDSRQSGEVSPALVFERQIVGVGEVRDLDVTQNDTATTIWLLTADKSPLYESRSATVDGDGRFGTTGKGPTDIVFPWHFASPAMGKKAPSIFDIGGRKLLSVNPDGSVSATMLGAMGHVSILGTYREAQLGIPRQVFAIKGGWVWNEVTGPVQSARALWPFRVVKSDSGDKQKTIFSRSMPPEMAAKPIQQVFVPPPLMARCSDSTFVVYLNEPDSMLWLDGAGNIRRRAKSGLVRRKISASDRLGYVRDRMVAENQRSRSRALPKAELEAEIKSAAENNGMAFADSAPRATTMLCQEDESVLLVKFGTAVSPLGYSNSIRAVSPNGTTIDYSLPVGFVPLRYKANHLWGVDDTALNGVRVVSLALNARNKP